VKRLAAFAAVLVALAAPALAHAAPPVARPNPALVGIRLDYSSPLPGADGKPATLAPLGRGVIVAATDDADFLRYLQPGDLGGFLPAPLARGGRDVHPRRFASELPVFARAAGGEVTSFLALTGQTTPTSPDNGAAPVPGLGTPTPPPPPTADTVPPANQGFGGAPQGGTTGTTTTTTSTTPTTTAVAPTGTTAGGGGSGSGPSGGGACGTAGLQIESTPPGCIVSIAGGAPGSSASAVMTITNTSSSTYTLSLRAEGANDNALWGDLEMGVYPQFTPPPSPLPPLAYWMAQFNDLTTLNPGQTIAYVVVLYLPTTAGNQDQGKSASIAFHWRALG